MTERRLILGYIPQDCHWVVLSPLGVQIGPRFSQEEPARDLFDEVADSWEDSDFDEINEYNDFDHFD